MIKAFSIRMVDVQKTLAILWVFSIALGPSVEAICFVLMLLTVLSMENVLQNCLRFIYAKWFVSLLLIVMWTSLSLIWSPDVNHEAWSNLKKLYRLLLLPLIIQGFVREEDCFKGLDAFLLGMCIPLCLSILKFLHLLSWRDSDPGHLFYNHILTGFLFAYAAFLGFESYIFHRKSWYFVVFIMFSSAVLLINPGRMAYILYLILMMYALWSRTNLKTKLIIFSLMAMVLCVLYYLSPSMHLALSGLSREIYAISQGQMNHSLGYRIRFNLFSWQLIKIHPWIGGGMGSFVYWFNQFNPMPDWPYQANAHSQYAMFLVETGLIGMSLFGLFACSLYQQARQNYFWGRIFIGLGLAILLNSFTDNIFNYCVNYLFLAISAMMLSQTKPKVAGNSV